MRALRAAKLIWKMLVIAIAVTPVVAVIGIVQIASICRDHVPFKFKLSCTFVLITSKLWSTIRSVIG